jgi:hypothetical protein
MTAGDRPSETFGNGRPPVLLRLAWARRRRLARDVPAEWRRQFDRQGFVEVRDFLSPETFAGIQSALLTREFDSREHQQGDTLTRRVAIGPALLREVPQLRTMFRSRRWRSLLA